MAFKANTSKAQEGSELKPEGFYECVIEKYAYKTTPGGSQSIGFTYTIRNDVEQKFKNGKLFHDIWKKKEPSPDDRMADGYNYNQLMAIAEAAGLPKEKDYDSFDAFLDALVGKPVKVQLYHEMYNNKTYEKIRSHKKTDYSVVKHVTKAPVEKSAVHTVADAEPVNDNDDYPF